MWFESIHIRVADQAILDARVGDVAFSGGVVQWGVLTRADRGWVLEQLDALLQRWRGEGAAPVEEWRLKGGRVGGRVVYALELGDAGAWRPGPAWEALDDAAREAIVARATTAVEAVYALVLID